MIRRLFSFAAAVSLLLLVATIVLWVRSYWVAESAWWRSPTETRRLALSRGELLLTFDRLSDSFPFVHVPDRGRRSELATELHVGSAGRGTAWEHFGFGYADGALVHGIYGISRSVLMPCWAIAGIPGTTPTVWLWLRMRGPKRRGRGRCVKCHYDLRATPSRCPECGHVPAKVEARV